MRLHVAGQQAAILRVPIAMLAIIAGIVFSQLATMVQTSAGMSGLRHTATDVNLQEY